MRTIIILIIVTSVCLVMFLNESPAVHENVFRTKIVEQINSLRKSKGIDQLIVDTIQCDAIERNMKKWMVENSCSFGPDTSVIEEIVAYIHDWEKQCFMATDEALDGIFKVFQEDPEFADAILNSAVSHISLGIAARPDGDMWCVMCIISRKVYLNPFEVEMCHDGPTYFTLSGISPYKHLRVRYYKGCEGPYSYHGTDDELVEVETDENSRFQVTLPISKFGKGEYQIIVYVKETRKKDFTIADHIHFHVR